ncbi:hypothetical protein [Bradyrhizobium sp. BWA-3-5]|uniref:hypothetical protein n=1 Tax=Bradyrhizobium sp. BWA-3-5 TaxID=3080013 RepID=UPI00293EDF0B|nr:hypothetical protein [Bradyrhizobium sp. BWA-3-5]WOH70074.1 hypothetical protein RX331_19260 [Bradyrhizobium sp. BWA-3-5]
MDALLTDVLAAFLATFFAAFFGAFFATLRAALFDTLLPFFATRLLLVALTAGFLAAVLLAARAGGDLRTFFALRFFEAFFPAFATTNSFISKTVGIVVG